MSSPKRGWQQASLPGDGRVLHSVETFCASIKEGHAPLWAGEAWWQGGGAWAGSQVTWRLVPASLLTSCVKSGNTLYPFGSLFAQLQDKNLSPDDFQVSLWLWNSFQFIWASSQVPGLLVHCQVLDWRGMLNAERGMTTWPEADLAPMNQAQSAPTDWVPLLCQASGRQLGMRGGRERLPHKLPVQQTRVCPEIWTTRRWPVAPMALLSPAKRYTQGPQNQEQSKGVQVEEGFSLLLDFPHLNQKFWWEREVSMKWPERSKIHFPQMIQHFNIHIVFSRQPK